MKEAALPLKLDGLNTDKVYENFVRQIAGEALTSARKQINSKSSSPDTAFIRAEVPPAENRLSMSLSQIDKEIPYHILFLLEHEGKYQAWTAYKEVAGSGTNPVKHILDLS